MCGGVLAFKHFGDVEIPDFGSTSHEEDVGRFDIPMYDMVVMEYFEPFENVVGYLPYKILAEFLQFFFFLLDEALGDKRDTARSPPSANSMRMQRVLPNS